MVVSYVGMEPQEVAVEPVLRVVLETSTQALSDVIVVAFGTAKRSSFTGSASTMSSEEISKRQVSNLTNALAGVVAGVQATSTSGQPGTKAEIRIRGVGSMAAGNNPLYVVDGVPYDGEISALNPADIESTTVLKDAASNALYGARGANGVVLITTKKGTSQKTTITVDAKWGTNRRAVPNYDVMKNPGMYLEKAYEAIYNSYYYQQNGTAENARNQALTYLPTNSNGGVGYTIYTVPSGQDLIGTDGKLNPNATLGYSDGTYYYTPDDWYEELFNKGNLRQEYNFSVSGASDKVSYYFSGNYLDDSGLMENSGFSRYSTRAKADYQAKTWLKLGANMAYTHYDLQTPADQTSSGSSANLFYIANYIAPIYPLYIRNADGSIKTDSRGYTVYDFGDNTSTNFNRTWMSGSNPAAMMQLDKRGYESDVISGRWFADVELLEGLKFTYNFGLDVDNSRYTRLYNAYYGQYSQVGGIVYVGNERKLGINHQQLFTYKKTFADVHFLDILLGHESYRYTYNYLRGSKENLFNPDIVEINNGISSPSVNSYTNKYSTEGYLSRVQYEYDSKYIIGASYRRDATSRFHPDNRWGNFGSVSGAWVINREEFLANVPWVNFLKYKISYGIQGNDALLYSDNLTPNYYPYQDQYEVSNSNEDFGSVLYYKGNKDITWETSHTFNTGVDFDFWNGKLSGSVEYFNKKTKDLLYYMPVPISIGYSEVPMNIGSIRNQGFEIDLRSEVISNKKMNWSIYANGTFLKNKILQLAPELKGELIADPRIYREGESMYQFYLRKYAGVNEEGLSLFYVDEVDSSGNVTGTTTTTDYNNATRYATGNILPTLYGGFGTSLNYSGFDFSISFTYQLGGKTLDEGYRSLMHGGSASSAGQNWHIDMLNSWSESNKNADIPRVDALQNFTNSRSDRFLISSNYLDISNITAGYTLPKELTRKFDIGNMRVFFMAENVYLFSKRKGFDPRQSYTASGAYRYSPIRSISGGVSLTF
ncbi:MAG: SusC/RagA family TonB-linked outer membrane protein [Tannerellaceae bacterium]|nr:SusC/RagA family TonB-linked outer membrane protein [Tannerellaceae bacterium]